MANEWKIGRHTLRIDPGRVAYIRYQGVFHIEEATEMVKIMHTAFGKAPSYIINDMAEIGAPDGQTRKLLATFLAEHDVVVLVNVGASALIRALSALVGSAMRVLHNRPHPVHFVATQEEARALIASLRARHASSNS